MRLPRQFVVLSTYDGRTLGQVTDTDTEKLVWSRTLRETSRGEVVLATDGNDALIESLRPWLHWVSVWDEDDHLCWAGPIMKVTIGTTTQIVARDVSALLSRTRCPVSKTWDTTDPGAIAAELWRLVVELHALRTRVQLVPTRGIDLFSYTAEADTKLVTAVMDDLVKLGLSWAVVRGTVVLGVGTSEPIAALSEDDFTSEIQLVLDGSATANNVRLQGKNWAATVSAELGGLNLQSIVTINDLYGVSNIERAAAQYATYTAAIRRALVIPGTSSLHPSAPVEIDELNPGARFTLQVRDTLTLMEIESMTSTTTADGTTIDLGLESVPVGLPEITSTSNAGADV